MGNITFTMIKPEAVAANNIGGIISMIEDGGFRVVSLKKVQLSKQRAGEFYAIHKERPFFNELTTFMSSGQTMVLALQKENAVSAWRATIGATNPEEAEEGTIRKEFATSLSKNAVHGADSDENAKIEIGFFFTDSELISYQ